MMTYEAARPARLSSVVVSDAPAGQARSSDPLPTSTVRCSALADRAGDRRRDEQLRPPSPVAGRKRDLHAYQQRKLRCVPPTIAPARLHVLVAGAEVAEFGIREAIDEGDFLSFRGLVLARAGAVASLAFLLRGFRIAQAPSQHQTDPSGTGATEQAILIDAAGEALCRRRSYELYGRVGAD